MSRTMRGHDQRRDGLSADLLEHGFELVRRLAHRLEPIQRYISEVEPSLLSPRSNPISSDAITHLSKENPQEFARRFFWKNLVKCTLAFLIVEKVLPPIHRIVDLGCGPGTFTFPASALLKNVAIIGIDHNLGQLALAKHLSDLCEIEKPALFRAKVPDDVVVTTGLFTASYLLAEMVNAERKNFANFVNNSREAAFLIVDYVNVVKDLHADIRPFRSCDCLSITAVLPTDLRKLVDDDQITFGVLYVSQFSRSA